MPDVTETGVTLETTADNRAALMRNTAQRMRRDDPDHLVSILAIHALCRDIDRLLADNETKANGIAELETAIERLKDDRDAFMRDRDEARAEFSRLKARPTSEEVERDFIVIEEFLSSSETWELADDSTPDAGPPSEALQRLRRLAAQSDGLDIPDAVECLKCIIAEQESGRTGREYIRGALASLGVVYMRGDGDRWPTFKEMVAAAVKTAQSDGWRPIETALRTTKAILVWCPERQNTYVVCWDDIAAEWHHFGGGHYPLNEEPTLWRPLPSPPLSPSTEGE